MQEIKGSVLAARLVFVRELAGKEGVERVFARLPPSDQKMLAMITLVRWYPFDVGARLDQAIVQELGKGDRAFFERLGEASASNNLSHLHASFLTPGDPMAFLAKAGMIYAMYYEGGRRVFEKIDARSAFLTTHDAETFSATDCLTVVGWYRRALVMCGAKKPTVVEVACRANGDAFCRYRCGWE
jgi:hypothetical protein